MNKKARCGRYLKNNTTRVVYRCGKQHDMLFMITVARGRTYVLHTWETSVIDRRLVTSDGGEELGYRTVHKWCAVWCFLNVQSRLVMENVRISFTEWSVYSFLFYLLFLLFSILWSIDIANDSERPARGKQERDPVRASGVWARVALSVALHR